MKTCIVGARVIMADRVTEGAVVLENGRIVSVGRVPSDIGEMHVINAEGLYLSPGFVDIHVHGGGGYGVMDCDAESVEQMCRTHLLHGTTSILPTTLASPVPILQKAILAVKEASEKQRYKTILGVHLEGPFLSPLQKGAQSEDSILAVTKERICGLLDTWSGIRMIGAAPEIPNIEILTEEAKRRGIALTIAHSDASYDEVLRAVLLGFTDVTHIYSGCSSVIRRMGFRVAGVVEAGLLLDELSVTAIADLCHLPPALLALIYKCKGSDRMSLITDALEPAGVEMENGMTYMQKNGVPALYEDGVMKLCDRTAFAGSASTMDMLVRNVKNALGLPIFEAVRMASATPASVIGANTKGRIEAGYDADLLLFNENIEIRHVFCGGEMVL